MCVASEPAGAAFIDSNVWVYAHLAGRGDARQAKAFALIQRDGELVISPQVVAEYYSVMLRNRQPDS